nr:PREDICTED: uncharacterized protein LOC103312758 [Tribolium castaneum]|eukprot:XP_008192426.1 PREDICTED: uncharacterized protein LOC103312758 [Tribolium castaneum]
MMELPNVVFARTNFLRQFMLNMNSEEHLKWNCVYLDETWIFENGTVTRSWQNESCKSTKKCKGEGKRYIVLHAGNKDGFIQGASLVFSSNSKNPDYHGEMNKDNFLHWFEYQLLCNLEEPSLIIMDNASYHSTLENKCPNSTWKKEQIRQWLQEHNIETPSSFLKPDLLRLVSE